MKCKKGATDTVLAILLTIFLVWKIAISIGAGLGAPTPELFDGVVLTIALFIALGMKAELEE